jgi:hypothetical protein
MVGAHARRYVRLLRAQRARGDSPGWKDVSRASGVRINSSTFYEVIRRDRTTLPPLRLVRAVVVACGGNAYQWASAWRAIALREFDRNNPLPAEEPQAGDGAVRLLKWPARKSSLAGAAAGSGARSGRARHRPRYPNLN